MFGRHSFGLHTAAFSSLASLTLLAFGLWWREGGGRLGASHRATAVVCPCVLVQFFGVIKQRLPCVNHLKYFEGEGEDESEGDGGKGLVGLPRFTSHNFEASLRQILIRLGTHAGRAWSTEKDRHLVALVTLPAQARRSALPHATAGATLRGSSRRA